MMTGVARAMGAISIVNAIASGKGATVSVDLPTSAKVTIREEKGRWRTFEGGKETESQLALNSLRRAILMLGRDPRRYSGSLDTRTSAPVGVGLKTSSSASVAIALAVCDAFGEGSPPTAAVLDCSVRSSFSSGASVTGAMDDAASCLLGGANFVDNSSKRILSRVRLGRALQVLITVPREESRRGSVRTRYVRRFSRIADSIFRMGLEGETWKAMTLNGLMYSSIYGYDPSLALRAVEAGALGSGLSGTGPSVAAVFESQNDVKRLGADWTEGDAQVIRTTTSDGGATVGP